MFHSFRKQRNQMHFSANLKEIQKGHFLSKMCRSKTSLKQQNVLRTLEIHYKIFDNSHLKIEKKEKTKKKKKHVRRLVLTSLGFLKKVVLQAFPKYSQSYVNLNVKKQSKINLSLKKVDGLFQRFLFELTCRTL